MLKRILATIGCLLLPAVVFAQGIPASRVPSLWDGFFLKTPTTGLPTCSAGLAGLARYDTTTNSMKFCNGTAWGSFGGGGSDSIAFNDDVALVWGTGSDSACEYDTQQTPDATVCGVGQDSRVWWFNEKGDAADYAVAQQTNPTVCVHSAATTAAQYWCVNHNGTDSVYNSTGSHAFQVSGTAEVFIGTNVVRVGSDGQFSWASTTNPGVAADAGIERLAAGVLAPTDGSTGLGWLQQQAGRVMLAADYTNATTSFTSTALSVTLTTGRKYTFHAELFVDNATDANGGKLDFNGGTATVANFRADCHEISTVLDNNTQQTTLAGTYVAATITGSGRWSCAGSFEPSGNGTFILRAASNGGATTFTMFRGSWMWVEDMP